LSVNKCRKNVRTETLKEFPVGWGEERTPGCWYRNPLIVGVRARNIWHVIRYMFARYALELCDFTALRLYNLAG